MLLCDQFARGAFRGTPDAFAFDRRGVEIRRGLLADRAHEEYDLVHWPFFLTPGEHSEELSDHRDNRVILNFASERHGAGHPAIVMLAKHSDEHTEIVERFGRYPHRNALYGRESTPEEQAWLDDVDNLPPFAKSQLPPKAEA